MLVNLDDYSTAGAIPEKINEKKNNFLPPPPAKATLTLIYEDFYTLFWELLSKYSRR